VNLPVIIEVPVLLWNVDGVLLARRVEDLVRVVVPRLVLALVPVPENKFIPCVPGIVALVASLLSQSACFQTKNIAPKNISFIIKSCCHILFSAGHFYFLILTLVGPTNVITTKMHA
jgi:hypothetical protein